MSKELSIAVIDDDDSFRIALTESLGSLGYGAQGFASAEEFLSGNWEALSRCIITDINMPGMSGLDLKRLLAARGSTKPVIMITGRLEPGLKARVLASGAICLLGKPFETEDLIACVELALGA